MHVLVTGLRAPAAVDWCRRLRADGHTVFGADGVRFPVGRASSSIEGFAKLSNLNQSDAWKSELEALIAKWKIDAIVPTCEEVFHFANAGPEIRDRLFACDFAMLYQLHHKALFAELVKNAGLEVRGALLAAPDSTLVDQADSLQELLPSERELRNWVFKPALSRFSTKTLVGPSRRQVASLQPSPAAPWVMQRRIHGHEFCSYSVAKAGRLLAHVCYRTPYRSGRGAGIYFEPFHDQQVEHAVRQLCQQLSYTGQLGLDWMEDSEGRCWLLEANPRATSGIHLLASESAWTAGLGLERNTDSEQELGEVDTGSLAPRMVAFAMPLWGLASAVRRGRLTSWWADVRRAHDVLSVTGDRKPPWLAPLSLTELALRAVTHRCSLNAASTLDMEWNRVVAQEE